MSMLRWSVTFFVIALVAAIFGFGGIAVGAEDISRLLFFIFVVMAVVTFVMDRSRR